MPREYKTSGEKPITVMVKPDLHEILKHRAEQNHRSVTKEVVYLIETALGCASENVRETMHLLYKAGVEFTEETTDQPASPAP
ncbi:hypothetical protein ASG32_08025 [Methylobacterium sp. Leaf361]|uniref:hypothetical protein n=1 Tax=Methylobacterium sp. Leaf361 TaxID=1736352 RepID=UPI0006F8A6C3|nr:hypothetical protein [Methylobacterium sp. Leaf361]KQS75034.1 hypothetical protein ASG32_08025 [Methylobacterium sp. Leaf361]